MKRGSSEGRSVERSNLEPNGLKTYQPRAKPWVAVTEVWQVEGLLHKSDQDERHIATSLSPLLGSDQDSTESRPTGFGFAAAVSNGAGPCLFGS